MTSGRIAGASSFTSFGRARGKGVGNAYVESFNGKFRDESLNEHWFVALTHPMEVIENWRMDYNEVRPHSSLGQAVPAEFARER